MPVFKNEDNGTWYVMARYVNWKGERKQKCKRGFATKKEAQEWERMFQLQNSSDLDMSFEAFTELYINDVKNRLKENTWLTKEHIIRTKILPYFGKLKISEISTKEIITWQNEMLAYRDEKKKPYSQTYLKTLHNQLSAIFNHLAHPSLFSTLTKILRTCPNTRSTNVAVCNGSSKICPHPSDDIRSPFPLNDLSVQRMVLTHPIKINTNFLKRIEGSCPPILLISSLPIFQRILKRHLQEPRPSPSA